MEPSVRSRAISGVLRLGVRPILHRIPGHPGGIRTAARPWTPRRC